MTPVFSRYFLNSSFLDSVVWVNIYVPGSSSILKLQLNVNILTTTQQLSTIPSNHFYYVEGHNKNETQRNNKIQIIFRIVQIIFKYCSSNFIFSYLKFIRNMIQNEQMVWQEELPNSQEDQQLISQLNTSIFNKSCINTVNLISMMLRQLPDLSNANSIQRLNISNNYLKQIPLELTNLKQLIANKNCIEIIPQVINTMQCLRILKINNNKISVIPFIKYIVHLQIEHNPINLIFRRLSQSNLKVMNFDWTYFLLPVQAANSQEQFRQLINLVNQIDIQAHWDKQFINFQQIFKVRNDKNQEQVLGALLHKAIVHGNIFFIDYIRSIAFNPENQTNFNKMSFLGKLLLQTALETDNQEAVKIFMMKKNNIRNPDIFWSNLQLACQFSNLELFDFLTLHSDKKLKINDKIMDLLGKVLLNFNLFKGSHYIINKILNLQKKKNYQNPTIKIPHNYNYRQAENIAKGLLYILKNQLLCSILSFDQSQDHLLDQPLFHFAPVTKNIDLIYTLIDLKMSPFFKNKKGITPKMVRGSLLARKTLWKIEKKIITKIFSQSLEVNEEKIYQVKKNKYLDYSEYFQNNLRKRRLSIQPVSYQQTAKSDYNLDDCDEQIKLKMQKSRRTVYLPSRMSRINRQYNFLQQSNIKNNIVNKFQQFNSFLNQECQHDYRLKIEQRPKSIITIRSPFKFCEDTSKQPDLQYKPRVIIKKKLTLTRRK